jgi:endogenous inhibitor of DNA gyrase (YacG/DUF329 family)
METYRCPICGKEFQAEGAGTFRCPSCSEEVKVIGAGFSEVPWDKESKGQWINAFYFTLKQSLIEPFVFFRAVAAGKGMIRPLVYGNIISLIVFIFAAAYQMGFQFIEAAPELASGIKDAIFPSLAVTGPLAILLFSVMGFLFVPVLVSLGIFIQSALLHLGLLIAGGAKRCFSDTFRTACYSLGPNVFQILPFIGGMISGVWLIVLNIIGLKVVHETTYPRSIFAVFLPLIFCCSIILLVLAAVAGGVFAAFISK